MTKKMKRNNDFAHEYTEERIEALDAFAAAVLANCEQSSKKLLKTYLKPYENELKIHRAALEAGEITQEAFDLWCNTTIYAGEWQDLVERIAQKYTKANQRIVKRLDRQLANVCAENYNYGLYQVAISDRD